MATTKEIEKLFKSHYGHMVRYAFLILRDVEVARDIVHDIFVSLLDNNHREITEPYLLASVRNRCLNYVRDLSVREKFIKLYSLEEKDFEDLKDFPDVESISMVNSIIENDLKPSCSRVMKMRFRDELSYKEIGEKLGISEVAVYKQLRRGIEILRQKMKSNG